MGREDDDFAEAVSDQATQADWFDAFYRQAESYR